MRNEPNKSEQDCMRTILENDGEFDKGNKHFLLVPQYKLNSYPDELGCVEDRERHWKQGDWIIHFPVCRFSLFANFEGAWAFMRDTKDPFGDLLRRYYPRIVY
jgi:mannan polymerase II complex MNN10 subunit